MKKIIAAALLTVALSACAAGGYQEKQFAMGKRACAELGLDPGSAAGVQCAIDLDASLFDATIAR